HAALGHSRTRGNAPTSAPLRPARVPPLSRGNARSATRCPRSHSIADPDPNLSSRRPIPVQTDFLKPRANQPQVPDMHLAAFRGGHQLTAVRAEPQPPHPAPLPPLPS